MVGKILDGRNFAAQIREKVSLEVEELIKNEGITPGLAVILVGEDPASEVYVKSKGKQTVQVGMNSYEYRLDKNTSETELLTLIKKLNNDSRCTRHFMPTAFARSFKL